MTIPDDLLNEIENILGSAISPSLTTASDTSDIFEAYVFSLVLEAARTEGATVTYRDVFGNIPSNFISTTGEIKVRVYCTSSSKSFTCSGDFMQIIVERQAAQQVAFKSGQVESGTPVSLEDKFRLFPNPVFDMLNIELEGVGKNELISVEILNIAGIKMKSQNITGVKTQLNLVDLPSGIYFVKVKTSANMYLRKIIRK